MLQPRLASAAEIRAIEAVSPIRIGTALYLIEFRRRMPKGYEDAAGYVEFTRRTIVLSPGRTFATIVEMLHHEVFHIFFDCFLHVEDLSKFDSHDSMKDVIDERVAGLYASGLMLLYLDNPKLLSLVHKVYGGGQRALLDATFSRKSKR
jgi:hypothetical protein